MVLMKILKKVGKIHKINNAMNLCSKKNQNERNKIDTCKTLNITLSPEEIMAVEDIDDLSPPELLVRAQGLEFMLESEKNLREEK